jgi:hypothetical protein
MPKKTRRSARPGLKRRTTPVRKKRGKGKAKRLAVTARTHEELLIRRLSQSPQKVQVRGLEMQDLIYNSAEELRSLAFKSGFNLGSEAYRNSDRSMSSLEHVLEHAGFGRVLYYPFESHSTFSSAMVRSGGINVSTNVHIFEAGIISGYLTAHSGQRVAVEETECVFNGSRYCRFIAGKEERMEAVPSLEFPNMILALQSALISAEKPSGGSSYYMMAVGPLLEEPVFSEASKFLYLAGKMLARSRMIPGFEQTIMRAANLLRIERSSIKVDRKGNVEVRLVYGRATSVNRFVDLTVAFISGLVKGLSGRGVRTERKLDSRGVYNVKMEVLGSLSKVGIR